VTEALLNRTRKSTLPSTVYDALALIAWVNEDRMFEDSEFVFDYWDIRPWNIILNENDDIV